MTDPTRDLLGRLEWNNHRHGVEPRSRHIDPMVFESCPFCGGIRPAPLEDEWGRLTPENHKPEMHFPTGEVGHGPNCLFPKALEESQPKEMENE